VSPAACYLSRGVIRGYAFVVGIALTLVGVAAAQEQMTAIDLSAMTPNAPPANFLFGRTGQGAPGLWLVVSEDSAYRGVAIAQISQDRTDYRFPLAIYQPATLKNGTVSVRFKPVSGEIDKAGGIAVRLATPNDYYLLRANALEDNVRFYRVVKGRRQQLAGTNIKVASGMWHTLDLRADGSHFTVSFDGTQMFTADDTTFPEGGKIALWTKADSVTLFDRIELTSTP
jgi:hypothetical protein